MIVRMKWLPDEIDYLKNSYSDVPMQEMMKVLNRSASKISNKASSLGLKRSDAFLSSEHSGRIMKGEIIGKKTQFKKGLAAWNKGKKQVDYMAAEKIEITKSTRFKKGSIPHNIKPIGYERITRDGYIEVKVRDSKTNSKNKNFELKHRLVWKEHYGEIPNGMNVEFIPGANKLNFTIRDLILRSRAENLIINTTSDDSIVKRFLGIKNPDLVSKIKSEMPELIILKRNTIQLNQQIRKHE